MATYYRWRKRKVTYEAVDDGVRVYNIGPLTNGAYVHNISIPTITSDGTIDLTNFIYNEPGTFGQIQLSKLKYWCIVKENPATEYWILYSGYDTFLSSDGALTNGVSHYYVDTKYGAASFVYSTNPSQYPDNGKSGDYYYDEKTEISSPSAPTALTYPNLITASPVTVSWNAATSNTSYPISKYQLEYSINDGNNWTVASSSITSTTRAVTIPSNAETIKFRVRAVDTNNQVSEYLTGTNSTVNLLPVTPESIMVPGQAIEGTSVAVSWGAAARATGYILQRNTGGGWFQVYSGAETSFPDTAGHWESLQYRVKATNQYGSSGWKLSNSISVLRSTALTVPSLAMQNQPITVNWTAIDGATSYTLQRKADTDADWAQVYSGPNLTFTEEAGTWTSVQYRVQATFSAGTGGWATSESIPVMSASALVISGSDGDLGTLVSDVPYTISTDTGNPISVRTTVNGAVIFAGEVESGAAKAIPVLDLVNGEGTIVIEASVETSSGTVSAARAWTYDKDLITFPNGGSPAQLTKEGKIVFPKTLAECVRLPGGRTLDKVMGFPCQIFVGSYTGTGTYGSANPNEVTIPFKPQIVFVSNGSVGTTIPMIRPLLKAKSSADLTVAWTDDGVSWSATSAANQMNAKGTEYMVVAFG